MLAENVAGGKFEKKPNGASWFNYSHDEWESKFAEVSSFLIGFKVCYLVRGKTVKSEEKN